MKKRLFSLLLALCMVLSLLPFGASAAEIVDSGTCGENLTWTLDSDGLLTVSGEGDMAGWEEGASPFSANESIRTVVIEPGVTAIGVNAFRGCGSMESVSLPEGLTQISDFAFYGCVSLASVSVPDSVTAIGSNAFLDCTGLTEVETGAGLLTVGGSAFRGCSALREISFADGLTSVGSYAFLDCSCLTSASLPDSVTSLGDYAFRGCGALRSAAIPVGVTALGTGTFYGCEQLQSVTLPDGLTELGVDTFCNCGKLQSVAIPSGVTRIGDHVFQYCFNLCSVKIPDGVKSIGDSAFEGCSSLQSVTLPDGLERIEAWAFDGCRSLTSFVIPESVTFLGWSVLAGCDGLTSVEIPDGVVSYEGLFQNCSNLTSARLPEGIDRIPGGLFLRCTSLKSFVIPDGVTTIGNSAFEGCAALTDVVIPESVTKLYDRAFWGCASLQAVSVPASMWGGCFQDCVKLERFEMTGGTGIGSDALRGCIMLRTVYLPGTLESIGENAFAADETLRDVWFDGTQAQWDAITIAAGNEALLNAALHTIPDITAQPQDAAVNAGDSVLFSVTATGENLTYQWQTGTDGEHWEDVSGETDDQLALTADASMDGRLYRCAVSDGRTTVYSDAAAVLVYTSPVVMTQPQDAAAFVDDSVAFSVSAMGESLSYLWQYSADGGATWKNSTASSAKTPQLTFAAKASFHGRLYRCAVSNALGTVFTEPVTLTILPKITAHPQSADVTAGDRVTLSVTATGANLTYLWQYSTDGGETWKDSTAKKAASITMQAKAAFDGRLYRCAVTSGDVTVYSEPARLTVDNPPVITKQPQSFTGVVGETAAITLSAQGNGLVCRWEFSEDGGETWWQSSSNSKTVKCRLNADRDGRLYRCVVMDEIGRTVVSDTVTLIVKPKITAQPKSLTAETGETVKLAVSAQGPELTYQWQLKTPTGDWKDTTAVSGKTPTLSVVATAGKSGYRYRCVITAANGTQTISSEALLTVTTPLRITAQPKSVVTEKGSTVKLTVAAQGTDLTYQWQLKTPGGDWRDTTAVSGRTATLSVVATAGKNAYQYRCVITDAMGNQVISDPALLAVY